MNDHPDTLGRAELQPQSMTAVAAPAANDVSPLLLAGASSSHCVVSPATPTVTSALRTFPPTPAPTTFPLPLIQVDLPPVTPQKRKRLTDSPSSGSSPTPPTKRRRTVGVQSPTPLRLSYVPENVKSMKVEDALHYRPDASTYSINRYNHNEKDWHGILSSAARKKNKLSRPVWSTKIPRSALSRTAGQKPILISEFAETTCRPPIWASDLTELRDAVPHFNHLDPEDLLRKRHTLFFDKTDQPRAGDGWTESGTVLTLTLSRSYTRAKGWSWTHSSPSVPSTHSSTPAPPKEEAIPSTSRCLEETISVSLSPPIPVTPDTTTLMLNVDESDPASKPEHASRDGLHTTAAEDQDWSSSVQLSLAAFANSDAYTAASLPLAGSDRIFKIEENSAASDSMLKSEAPADATSSVAFTPINLWSGSIVEASSHVPLDVYFGANPPTLLEKQARREIVRTSRDGCTLSEPEQVMLPPEMKAVWSIASQRQPLLVVCHRDWPLAPCKFGETAAVGYVGCFMIDHIHEEVEDSATSAQGVVHWRLKLRWVSHPRLDVQTSNLQPWYTAIRSTAYPPASTVAWDKLGVNPVSHPLETESQIPDDINANNIPCDIRGWVCKCGRANRRWALQNLSCIQEGCQQPSFRVPMPDFTAILNDHRVEPQFIVPDLVWDKAALHTYVADPKTAPKRVEYNGGTSVVVYTHGISLGFLPVHRVSRIAGFAATKGFSCDILKAYYAGVPFKSVFSSTYKVVPLSIPEKIVEFSLPSGRYGPGKSLPPVFAHGISTAWEEKIGGSPPAWHTQTLALFERLHDLCEVPSSEADRRVLVALFWPASLSRGLIIRALRDKSRDLAVVAFGSLVSMIDVSRPTITEPAKKGKDALKPTPFTLSLNSGDAFIVEARTPASVASSIIGTPAQQTSTPLLSSEIEVDAMGIDVLTAPATPRIDRKQRKPTVPKRSSQLSGTKSKAITHVTSEEILPTLLTTNNDELWRIESKGPAMLLLSFTRR